MRNRERGEDQERASRVRTILGTLGPGLIAGAADDDPSSIATYASAGATLGFGLLWTTVVTIPLMAALQINADRVALATGRSFGDLARTRFGRVGRRVTSVALVVHLLANILVTTADLLAIGAGMQLLGAGASAPWSLIAGAGITVGLATGSFDAIARVFKVLCLSLLAYVAVLAFLDVNWLDALHHTFIPSFPVNRTSIRLLLAVLGGTLPPFVFFWQNIHRVEDMRSAPEGGTEPLPLHRRGVRDVELTERRSILDVLAGMIFAIAVMFGIMVALAVTAGRTGHRDIASASDAALALQPVAGPLAKALFAAGFVAAGILAVPVLAGAAAANLSGLAGREWGFSRSIGDAKAFYAVVAVATLGGSILGLSGIDPIRLLVLAATINGISAGPLLGFVMWMASDREVVGPHRAGRIIRSLGWIAVGLMAACALSALVLAA